MPPLTPCTSVLYGYALAYLVAPETFASANVIELIHGLPEAVKYAGKTILAAPFAFHSINGLRHLAWDSGRCMSPALSTLCLSSIDCCIYSAYPEGCLHFWVRSVGSVCYRHSWACFVVNNDQTVKSHCCIFQRPLVSIS